MSNYPNDLRFHREHAGLTQSEVAAHLGLASTNRLCRWEQGLAYPSLLNLFKLAVIYGVQPHELYRGAVAES